VYDEMIKPSLQFSCNFVVFNASPFLKILILHNSRCQVPCGGCKKLPRTSRKCCYIFWSFWNISSSTFKCVLVITFIKRVKNTHSIHEANLCFTSMIIRSYFRFLCVILIEDKRQKHK
jgi:hypothetical protein